jgi:hypothetical protein
VDAGNSWKILWRHAEEMTMNVDIFLYSEILCGYFPFNPKGCLNAKSKTLMRYERETDGTQHPPSPSWLLFARGVVVSACIHIFVKLCSWMPPYVYIYKYTIRCVCVQVYISLMPRQAPELNITNACPNKYPHWSGVDVWLNDAMYLTLITN